MLFYLIKKTMSPFTVIQRQTRVSTIFEPEEVVNLRAVARDCAVKVRSLI